MDRVRPPPALDRDDPLGDALDALRLSGTFYSCAELTTPWGIALPAFDECMMFHVVTEGRCLLDVPGTEPRWLEAGSLALVTRGEGHAVRSAPGVPDTELFDIPARPLSERCEWLTFGGPTTTRERADGSSPRCRATCGVVRFDHAAARHLREILPRVLEIRPSDDDEGTWLDGTIRFLAREAETLRPGAETVLTRLADILVVQAIRAWLATDGATERSALAALADPRLGRALALMHRQPDHDWSVGALAKAVGMSRSAFAAHFTERVGRPAGTYLTELRLRLAYDELRQGREAIGTIAERFGYRSEAAFTRAFGREFGRTPTAVRRGAAGSGSTTNGLG